MKTSIQDEYAPNLRCFGCGPRNENGLQLKSFVEGDSIVAEWIGDAKHQAFDGVLNGGIIGTLLDCHCNWAAVINLKSVNELEKPPVCVTAEYTIKMHHPTPVGKTLHLKAWAESAKRRRAVIRGEIRCDGQLTAECHGVFVAVKPGHPAYHRFD